VPILDRRGRQLYRWRRGEKEPQFEASEPVETLWCPLTWDPPIEMADVANGTHAKWLDAMERLAAQLAGIVFRDHVVTERSP